MTRKSTTGYALFMGAGLILWTSGRQATVSRCTAEAEYIAAGDISKAVTYLQQIAQQIGVPPHLVHVGIDNEAALCLTEDPLSEARAKPIDIAYHHVRERVENGVLKFYFVPTAENTADIFTKPLGQELFMRHRKSLGIVQS